MISMSFPTADHRIYLRANDTHSTEHNSVAGAPASNHDQPLALYALHGCWRPLCTVQKSDENAPYGGGEAFVMVTMYFRTADCRTHLRANDTHYLVLAVVTGTLQNHNSVTVVPVSNHDQPLMLSALHSCRVPTTIQIWT